MTMGRPPKWKTPEDLFDAVKSYFKHIEDSPGKMPTKAGLAIHLDTTRETLGDYEKKENFSDAIKKAYILIEEAWNQRLAGTTPTGSIFYLKAAFLYRDRVDITSDDKKLPNPIYGGKSADEGDTA